MVEKAGTGNGTVTSSPAGIDCGLDCSEEYANGTPVTLSAEADPGSQFVDWSGACSGPGACMVTMDADKAVTARFDTTGMPQPFTLTVSKGGDGSGIVTSSPAGIDCGLDCSEEYANGTVVTLSAEADAGSEFVSWSGACTGTGACMVTTDADKAVTATFDQAATDTFTLAVTRAGTGNGTVTSSPGGIDCGTDCSESYPDGTEITLTAAPDEDSTFSGWSGGGCSGTAACTISPTADTTVTATFTLSAAQIFALPHVANGQFAGGSIRTTFVFFNTGAETVSLTLTLTRDDGGPPQVTIPELGTDDRFELTLGPWETQLFQTDGSGSVAAGAATVTATAPIGVSAIFSIFDTAGNFLTEAGVDSSPMLTDFLIPVDSTGLFNTGLALFNRDSGNALITFRLLDSSGQEIGSTTLILGGRGHLAKFVAGELFPEVSNLRGTLVVSSTLPIAALTLRQNSSPLSFTTLPVLSATSAQLGFNLPQVANGEFAVGSIRTTFIIFNGSAGRATIELSLTLDDGSPFTITIPAVGTNSIFNLEFEPGATVFLQTDGLGELMLGAATVTSDVPIGVAAIFSVFDTEGRFQTEAGVGDSRALKEFAIPVDITGTFDTGVAFLNRGTEAVTLSLGLVDSGAENVQTAQPISLEVDGHLARFVSELFPGTTNFRGSLFFSASGNVAALTLRQNSATLSFTTLPVAFSGGSPIVTGTWQGTYDLTVSLEGLCPNLNSITHSGNLTITFTQVGGAFTGTATLTGVRELELDGASNCVETSVSTLTGEVEGTISGKSVAGQINLSTNGAGATLLEHEGSLHFWDLQFPGTCCPLRRREGVHGRLVRSGNRQLPLYKE